MATKYLNELKIRQVDSEGVPHIHQLKLRSGALDMTNINSNIAVAWANVFDKPAVLDFNAISVSDTRAVTSVPEDIPSNAVSFEFKQNASVGNPPNAVSYGYSHIINVAGWNSNEGSGGWPSQISVGTSSLAVRQATSATTWGPWKDLANPLWSEVIGKPSTFPPSSHTHNYLPNSYLSGLSLSDANSANGTGVTANHLLTAASNKPGSADYSLLTLSYSTAWSTQLAGDWRTNEWYVRNQNSGTWGSWRKLWHDGNVPTTATRWPTWSEVTSKPANNQFPNTAEAIGSSKNLNNYTTPGFYYQNANASAANGSNYPVAQAGTLVVTKDAGTTQMYYHYNGSGIYYRTFYGSSWSSWQNILTPAWSSVSGKPAQATRWPTWSEVTSKPSTFAPSSHTHSRSQTTLRGATTIASGGSYSLSQSIYNFDLIIIHFSSSYDSSTNYNADTLTIYPHGQPTGDTGAFSGGYGRTGRWVGWRFTSATTLHVVGLTNTLTPRIRAVYGVKFT